MGIKKWIATGVAAIMLMGAGGIALAEESKNRGVVASFKNAITLYEHEGLNFTYLGDHFRMEQRANNNDRVRPQEVIGVRNSDGSYRILISFGFFNVPYGSMSAEMVLVAVPSMEVLKDNMPQFFTTFMGYEDIFAYVDLGENEKEIVLKLIRDLYEVEFASYNNAAFGR